MFCFVFINNILRLIKIDQLYLDNISKSVFNTFLTLAACGYDVIRSNPIHMLQVLEKY